MNKFSIIVPMYNAEKYIERCINSLLNQTYTNIEIIIVDDGSKDASYNICQKFLEEDNRIKLISKKNNGVSSARNVGIQNACGDYIAFVDSDDYLEENAVQIINDNLDSKLDLLIYEMWSINYKTKTYIPCSMDGTYEIKELFYKLMDNPKSIERINSVWSKVYRLDVIQENNICFDEEIKIGEDLLFNINYLKYVKNIKWIKDRIYNYDISNSDSITKKYMEDKYIQLKKVNMEFEKFLKNFDEENFLKLSSYINLKNIYSCMLDLNHKDCKYSFKEKMNFIKQIKKKNKNIIIKDMGKDYFLLSLVYSYLSPFFLVIISRLINMIKGTKKRLGYLINIIK